MKTCIWQRVIKDKYFPHGSMLSWLRSTTSITSYGSQTWKNLLNTLPVILQWSAWNLGLGHSILVGKDAILEMGKDVILSQELVHNLNQINIHILYQANRTLPRGSIGSYWFDSVELGLVGELAAEWDKYMHNLISLGIKLMDRPDELIWTGGDSSGQISIRKVYSALSKNLWKFKTRGWRRNLWKWDCPMKINLFVWLLAENKILT